MFFRIILADLESGRLTPLEALELSGCFDLLELHEVAAAEAESLDGSGGPAGASVQR